MTMSFNELERKRYETIVGSFIEERRPAPDIRDKVAVGFRLP